MKKGKTVTLYIANSNCSTSMDAYREQQAVEEVEGQEQPSHWELWIGRVQGCADPAAVLPSPGFVMKGFPFVEIAGCRQEDVVEFYEGHFAKVHEHGSPRKALRRLRGYVRKRRPGGRLRRPRGEHMRRKRLCWLLRGPLWRPERVWNSSSRREIDA
jgi:hypothetical protein